MTEFDPSKSVFAEELRDSASPEPTRPRPRRASGGPADLDDLFGEPETDPDLARQRQPGPGRLRVKTW